MAAHADYSFERIVDRLSRCRATISIDVERQGSMNAALSQQIRDRMATSHDIQELKQLLYIQLL
jgi:hypothetical protein